jgi:hypothetical protein
VAVTDLRESLAHVLWIGGGPRVGKTTLSRLLAGKFDLKIYNLDWHQVREHRERSGEANAWWQERSIDERWVQPTPQELVERSIAAWTEGFALVIEDLLALPRSRPIAAEGPGALPWCVAPVIASPRQAIFLVPTPELRDRVAERRSRGGVRFGDDTSDPDRARSNVRLRDELLGERIVESCRELTLRYEVLDGSLDLDTSSELIEEHFRPHLPTTYNA